MFIYIAGAVILPVIFVGDHLPVGNVAPEIRTYDGQSIGQKIFGVESFVAVKTDPVID